MVKSQDSGYTITDAGLRFIRQLEEGLEAFRKYERASTASKPSAPLVDLTVEVSRIQPSGHITVGVFQVYATRVIRLEERQELDRALSQAIRIISSAIPKDAKGYHVLVSGSLQ